MVPKASKKCGRLPPDHQQIGCCASIIKSGQLPGTFSHSRSHRLLQGISTKREQGYSPGSRSYETAILS
jgi:hypothetical protein